MLTTLAIASVLLGADAPAQTKIIEASLFKNGYAVVLREIPLDADGETIIADVPRPTVGTLWFTTSGSATIESVTATTETTPGEMQVGTIDEIITLNVGKEATLTLVDGTKVVGTITSVRGQVITMKTADGVMIFNRAEIKRVILKSTPNTTVKTSTSRRILRMRHHGTGKAFMFGLEAGLSWSPAYAIDISDPKLLQITAKATLINDLGPLHNLNVNLMTGFPNVPFLGELDPLIANQMTFSGGSPMTTGGFGGGGGGFGMQNMAPAADARRAFNEGMAMTSLSGTQEGDLFFYKQQGVTLMPSERSYVILFNAKAPYEHIYTWEIDDSVDQNNIYRGIPEGPGDVWHSIEFADTAGQPLTTAPAIIMARDQILGQDMLNYTTAGTTTKVRMSKALDVHAEGLEEEISRERVHLRSDTDWWDLVTVKGTLEVTNNKSEAIKLAITKYLTGDCIGHEEPEPSAAPKISKTTRGLRSVNPNTKLAWGPTIGSGKTIQLRYTYKVYLHI